MAWLYHPLLLLIAKSTDSQLAKEVEFLKAENQMLRRRFGKHMRPSAQEWELLIRLGQALGTRAVAALITVVTYRTWQRQVRQAKQQAHKPVATRRTPGRPKTSDEIIQLVLRLARDNDGWGYTRILGELRKLRIKTSRATVINILRHHGHNPRTDPTKGTWAEFLKAHAASLWQCDFFSKHVATPEGVLRQCSVMVFVHMASRRVFVSPGSFKMDEAWVVRQTRAFIEHAKTTGMPVGIVLHDRDSAFYPAFDETLAAEGAEARKLNFRSPNTNAYVERFVQSIQKECLDKFIAFGPEHMDHLIREYVEHYHTERPHQGKGNVPLTGPSDAESRVADGEIVCRERLGGILRHYHRTAA